MIKTIAAVLAAGVATVALAGTAVAAPDSASKCGSKFCIDVKGSGLHVDSATVSLKSGNAATGYFYLEASGSSTTFFWSSKVTATSVTFYDITFSSNVELCGGEAPTKSNTDHVGDGCVSVHS
jgi:hypothetical protein